MPSLVNDTDAGTVEIHYDLEGDADGFPVLLIAPGGMRSSNAIWDEMPWNPRTALADEGYLLIGMDQRNAGRSLAPVSPHDGWNTYRADQLALLDDLGVERCHVIGMCIGGPYIAGLLTAAPERFASAVLLQPVGVDDENRPLFFEMFERWVGLKAESHPDVERAVWDSFRDNMWGDAEFVVTATDQQVASIDVPMLVAMGNDEYHPQWTSRRIVEVNPGATLVERWKDEASLPATDHTIKAFLRANTP